MSESGTKTPPQEQNNLLLTQPLDLVASPVRRMMWPEAFPGYLQTNGYDYNRCVMLQDEVKRLALYCGQLEEEVAVLKKDNTLLTDVVDERDQRLVALEATVLQRDNAVAELRAQVVNLNGLVGERQRLAHKLNTTNQQLSARVQELTVWSDKQSQDLLTANDTLKQLENEVDSLNANLGEMNATHAADAQNYQALSDQHDAHLLKYGEQNNHYENEMKNLHQQLVNANDRAVVLQTDNGTLETRVTVLKNQLTKCKVEYDAEVTGLHGKLSEASQQARTLQGLIDDRIGQVALLNTRVSDLTAQNENLAQDNLGLQNRCAQADMDNQKLSNVNQQLTLTVQQRDATVVTLTSDVARLENDLRALHDQLKSSENERQLLQQKSNDAILSLEQDKQILNTNLAETNAVVQQREVQVSTLNSNLVQSELQRNQLVSNLNYRYTPYMNGGLNPGLNPALGGGLNPALSTLGGPLGGYRPLNYSYLA